MYLRYLPQSACQMITVIITYEWYYIVVYTEHMRQIWTIILQVRQLHISYFIQRNILGFSVTDTVLQVWIWPKWLPRITHTHTHIHIHKHIRNIAKNEVKNIESCDLYISFEYFGGMNDWTLDVTMINIRSLSLSELLYDHLIRIFYSLPFQISTYDSASFSTNKNQHFFKIHLETERKRVLCLSNRVSGKWMEYWVIVSS